MKFSSHFRLFIWISSSIGCGVLLGRSLYTISSPTSTRILAPQAVLSDKGFGNVVVDEVTSVYDGDTFRVNITQWPDLIGQRIGIRVSGIDTPEKRGTTDDIKKLSMAAREVTATLLKDAETIELRNVQRGKYFRIIADVYVDDKDLGQILIDQKLAKPYDGGTKPTWTQKDYER